MEACFQNGLSGEQTPRTKENKSSRKRRRCQRLSSICCYAVQTLPPAIGMVADGCASGKHTVNPQSLIYRVKQEPLLHIKQNCI